MLLSAGLILGLDRVAKQFALRPSLARGRPRPWWAPRIRPVHNSRLGVGLLPARLHTRFMLGLLWAAAAAGTVLLSVHVEAFRAPAAQVGLGAALGGATGNLVDMLRRGAVVDFIDLRGWPVFNVADAAIVLGVAGALWSTV